MLLCLFKTGYRSAPEFMDDSYFSVMIKGRPNRFCVHETYPDGTQLQGCQDPRLLNKCGRNGLRSFSRLGEDFYCNSGVSKRVKSSVLMQFTTPVANLSAPTAVLHGLFLNGWVDFLVKMTDIKLQFDDPFQFESHHPWEIMDRKKEFFARRLEREDHLAIVISAENFTDERIALFAEIASTLGGSLPYEQILIKKQVLIDYYYNVTFELSELQKHFEVSVPGFYEGLTINFSKPYEISANCFLKIYYFPNMYSMERGNWHKCEPLRVTYKYSYCLNYTSVMNPNRHYVYFRNYIYDSYGVMFKWQPKSWLTAMDVCKSIGGTLPVFLNEKDLHEVLGLFKMYFAPTEAIFLGMVRSWKVGIRFYDP